MPVDDEFRLTPRLAQVVKLVAGDSLSYRECAEKMGVTFRTVVSHATRIRDQSGLDLPPKAAIHHLYQHHPICWRAPRKAR